MARGGDAGLEDEAAAAFAAYVASLTEELSRLARDHHFNALAYLLEITRLEARSLSEVDEALPGRSR